MRSLDVSPLDPVGVNQNKLRFLEAFAAFCVLVPSDYMSHSDQFVLESNHVTVARRGREPGLALDLSGRAVSMRAWASEILESMQGICELLDQGDATRPYSSALASQAAKLSNAEATPSARLLKELTATGESFFELAMRMSHTYRGYFNELASLDDARLARFQEEVAQSLEDQQRLERSTQVPFDEYLAGYLAD
jgi:glutamate--cysteine ligase